MNSHTSFLSKVASIADASGARLESSGYSGKDPYQLDHFLSSAAGNRLSGSIIGTIRRLLKPYHALIPRRLFEITPSVIIPQALGDVLSAESYRPKNDIAVRRGKRLLDLLDRSRSPLSASYSWGLPFAWGGANPHPPHWPTMITTAIVVNGLLDAIPLLGEEAVRQRVASALHFMVEECGFEETDAGICFHFGPGDTRLILNVSAAGASVLARGGQLLGRDDYVELAQRAARLVASHQNPDGSWYYAPAHKEHPVDTIIDSRHTGYILESLKHLNTFFQDPQIERAIAVGWQYNKAYLLEGEKPRWSPEQTWPVDSHDVAQAILTALALGEHSAAESHLRFAIDSFYMGHGLFRYKLFKDGKSNDAIFIRWTQAPMYKALSAYLHYHEQAGA